MDNTDIAIMMDLETLSTKSNAAIAAIGAYAFSRKELLEDPFYVIIDPESAEKYGHISGSTFAWWCQQSDAARVIFARTTPKENLKTALEKFCTWCQPIANINTPRVWGNGADFDNVILNHAFEQVGIRAPWRFSNNRCFRTLKSFISPAQQNVLWNKHSEALTHHSALHDAKRQALMAIDIMDMVFK